MVKRPLSVTILGCLYIAVGAIGFVYHIKEFDIWIELVRLAAVLAGVFLLRGHDWARWLAIAWIVFHVVVGALHSLPQFAIHAVFCAVITWLLLRPEASRYFRKNIWPPS